MIVDPVIQYEDLPLFCFNPTNRRILQKIGSFALLSPPLASSSTSSQSFSISETDEDNENGKLSKIPNNTTKTLTVSKSLPLTVLLIILNHKNLFLKLKHPITS